MVFHNAIDLAPILAGIGHVVDRPHLSKDCNIGLSIELVVMTGAQITERNSRDSGPRAASVEGGVWLTDEGVAGEVVILQDAGVPHIKAQLSTNDDMVRPMRGGMPKVVLGVGHH